MVISFSLTVKLLNGGKKAVSARTKRLTFSGSRNKPAGRLFCERAHAQV